MKLEDIQPQDRVAYVPTHAHGNLKHKDVELGIVSSTNTRFAFVKFDKQLIKFGWEGTTSQSCQPDDLVFIYKPQKTVPKLSPKESP